MIRIIPRLDIKGPNLVKGIHLEGLRVLGNPQDFAQYYYENGADEIFFQDVVASLFERNSLHEIISNTAKNIFIPITVGGGIRTLDDINNVLRAGADKVCLNTAAIRDPKFIEDAVKVFGSSTIVIAIEAIKQDDGRYLAFIDNGREYTGVEVTEWATRLQEIGVGEIVLTSVDNEGTGNGFLIDLINKVNEVIQIPLIVHGGGQTLENMIDAIKFGADGLALASVLHYKIAKQFTNDKSRITEGNLTYLNNGQIRKMNTLTIQQIKEKLKIEGVPFRPL